MSPTWKRFIVVVAVMLMCLASFGVGVAAGPGVEGAMGMAPVADKGIPVEFRTLLQVWSLVNDNFVDHKAVDPKRMAYAAINAMLATLHDTGHTRFLTADEYRGQQEHFQGQFTGIGTTVAVRDHHPVILEPLAGAPADKAGLRADDVILAIDGHDTTDMTPDDAAKLIRGRRGTTLVLKIERGGGAPFDVNVVRDVIPIVTIHWQVLGGSDVADISIGEFSDGTDRKLDDAIAAAKKEGAKRFIIDVRDDPGGLLAESVGVTSAFLTQGTVLIEEDAKGGKQTYKVDGHAVAPTEPVIVLVNKNTASAAEIFAGAMKDNRRAQIVGSTTLGTGTVLSTYQLKDGSALLLGTQQWLTPSGQTIKDHGITPDEVVSLPEGATTLQPGGKSFPKNWQDAAHADDLQLAAAVRAFTDQDTSQRPTNGTG